MLKNETKYRYQKRIRELEDLKDRYRRSHERLKYIGMRLAEMDGTSVKVGWVLGQIVELL